MPNLNAYKSAMGVVLANCLIVLYSIYFDLDYLKYPYSHLYLIAKISLAFAPIFWLYFFRNVPLDKKLYWLGMGWTLYCAGSIYFISINYIVGSLQLAIAYIGFFFLDKKEFTILYLFVFILTLFAFHYSPSPYGFGSLSKEMKSIYQDDFITLMLMTALSYIFFLYPRIKKIKEDLKFSNIGKASSFILHEIQKPLSRIQDKNFADEDIDSLRKTVAIAKKLQTDSLNDSNKTAVNLKEITESILKNYQEYLEYFQIKITFHYEYEIYRCDLSAITLILDNFIRNAIEANKENEDGKRWIEIKSTKTKIMISNPYLNTISQENLFMPLKSTKPGNMGVGLHLCKTISDAQGHVLDVKLKNNIFAANIII